MAQSVANLNASLNLESASFVSGAEKARRAMQASMTGIQADVSKTSLALQGATAAVGGFVKGLAITTGAGLGIAGIVGLATRAAREFAEAEQAQAKFASVLKATGNTAGVTAAEVSKLADAMEATGTVTAEAVTGAAAELATFKSVSGDTFTTALKLAQDLSVVFGQSLSSSAVQLGKALQDPVEGISALKRVGVSFSDTQLELIKNFVALGDVASAQKLILGELASQVGGATDAQANTLTGKFTAASAAVGNLLERLFELSGQAESTKNALDKIAAAANSAFGGPDNEQQQRLEAFSKLQEAQKKLAELQAAPVQGLGTGLQIAETQKEVATLSAEVDRLGTSIKRVGEIEKNTLRQRAESGSLLSPGEKGGSSKALFPDTTAQQIEDQKKRVADAASQQTKIVSSAAKDHVAIAAKTNDDLARLDEERANDFAESLRSEQADIDKHLADRQRAYADAYQNIADENEKALADEARARDRAAEVQADIYAQPFKDLATNISRTLSSGIQDALSGDFDFATFAEGFGDIFADTLASSITAALAPALTSAAENFGTVLTNALKGAAGGPGLSVGAAALGGGLFGGIAGSLYGQYGGLKPGNQAGLGGGLGGAGGAALGAFLMPTNPLLGAGIGGVAGGLLGSLTGGLFGGQNNLGNDRSAQAYRSGRGITYSDASFSPENRNVTAGVLAEVATLQKALEAAGGAIADFGLRIEAGNKSGITVNGKTYPNAQAALAASLEVLIGNTSALSATQQTVLANTKGKDAAGIGADLAIGEQFDALTFSGTELERSLVALDAEMASFGKQAQALGLDINAVAAAHQKQRQSLIDAQAAEQNAIRGAIEQLAPSGNALEIQLAQLNDQVQQLALAATAAGLPLDQLAAAHQQAAATLTAAFQAQRDAIQNEIEALAPAGNTLEIQLAQLNDQVQQLAQAALAAGLPLDQLAAAHQRAAAAVVAAHNQLVSGLQNQVANIDPASNQTDLALANLNQQVQVIAAGLLAAGQSLDGLAAAHQRAGAQIIADAKAAQRAQAEAAAAQRQAAQEQQRAAAEQRKAAAELARAQAAAARQQVIGFQAQVKLLEADPLDAALTNIQEHIRGLIEMGKPLGLTSSAEAQIRAAGLRLEATARVQFKLDQDNLIEQLRSMGVATNDSTRQFAQLDLTFRELKARAVEYLIPLAEVTAAQARATQALKDKLAAEKAAVQEQIASARGDTGLPEQLRVLDLEMKELAKAAAAVGIPLAEVTAAHVKAAENLRLAFDLQKLNVQEQIASARGDKGLPEQLRQLDVRMRELARAAAEVGIPLAEVSAAHVKAAENLRLAFDLQKQGVLDKIQSVGGSNTLPEQLAALDVQMRELGRAATEVGIPLSQVTAAHVKAAAAIRESFEQRKRELLAQVDELGQFGTPLARSLGALQTQVEELRKELIAAGLPIDQLALAHTRAAQRIRDEWADTLRQMQRQLRDASQGILQAQRDAAGAVDAFLDPFKEALSSRGIGQGVYSGASLTESSIKEFRAVLKEARTGDTGALSSLVGIGQSAIQQARETYGSTAAFAEIFKEVERGLREQTGVLEAKRDQLLTQIGSFTRETVDELIRLRTQAIADLRADFAKLSRDLVVAVEGTR